MPSESWSERECDARESMRSKSTSELKRPNAFFRLHLFELSSIRLEPAGESHDVISVHLHDDPDPGAVESAQFRTSERISVSAPPRQSRPSSRLDRSGMSTTPARVDEERAQSTDSTIHSISESPRITDSESASSLSKPLDDPSSTGPILPYSRRSTLSTTPATPDEQSQLSQFEQRIQRRFSEVTQAVRRRPVIVKFEGYLRGPKVPLAPTMVKPWFPKIESFFDRLFRPLSLRPKLVLPIFLLIWFLAFLFKVRKSYFTSFTTLEEQDVSFISGSASFWNKNEGCGINGTNCGPFEDPKLSFRCPVRRIPSFSLDSTTLIRTI